MDYLKSKIIQTILPDTNDSVLSLITSSGLEYVKGICSGQAYVKDISYVIV